MEKTNATKSWFFERIKKSNESLARLTKEKRESAQTISIRNKRDVITTKLLNIKRIINTICKKLYAHKLDRLD